MHEVDDELREIKREIVESRGLIIKTNNLINALSADVKSIAKRQQSYERRITWNSAAAYVVFVVVVFIALKFAWDARVDSIKGETEQKSADNDRLRKEVRETQKHDENRARAEAKAAQFYELLRQGKKAQMVEAWESLSKEPLSKVELSVFSDAAEQARTELHTVSYQQGQEKVRVQRWQEAASLFEESLRYKSDSPIAPSVKLALADAYRHLNRQADAVPILSQIADNAPDKEVQDDALFQLAYCQTELQSWNDAKTTWKALIRRFPDSHFVSEARLRLGELNLVH